MSESDLHEFRPRVHLINSSPPPLLVGQPLVHGAKVPLGVGLEARGWSRSGCRVGRHVSLCVWCWRLEDDGRS